MTFPIRNLREAVSLLDRYQTEDRPLNLEESRQLRDLLTALVANGDSALRFLRSARLPPDISLARQNLETVIGI